MKRDRNLKVDSAAVAVATVETVAAAAAAGVANLGGNEMSKEQFAGLLFFYFRDLP